MEPPTPKSNADFRRLLSTPARASNDGDLRFRRPAGKPSGGRIDLGSATGTKVKKDKDDKAHKHKQRQQKEAVAPKYRDRAKERRDGANPDYEEGIVQRPAGFQAVPPPEGVSAEEIRKKEIEESKFLGGDIEHTHLVKGLDYALLNKIRSEMEKEKRKEMNEDKDEVEVKNEAPKKPVFRTPLGQSLHYLLFEQNEFMIKHRLELGQVNGKTRTVDRFLKGRTTFVFDLTDLRAELPTTLLRSKEDCPKVEAKMTASINEDVLKQVSNVMGHLRPRERRKKDKKSKKGKENEITEQPHTKVSDENSDAVVRPPKSEIRPDLTDLMSLGFLKPATTEAPRASSSEDSIFPDVDDNYVCMPSAEQMERARAAKLVEAKRLQETAVQTKPEELVVDEEEQALLRELMGTSKETSSSVGSLHEREQRYREEHQSRGRAGDYFGNVKDAGEEEDEPDSYLPKIKIKGVTDNKTKNAESFDNVDDTNEVEMDIEDDNESSTPAVIGPAPGPIGPPSIEAYSTSASLLPMATTVTEHSGPSVGPEMGPAVPGVAAYPEPYEAAYGTHESWAYPDTDAQYGAYPDTDAQYGPAQSTAESSAPKPSLPDVSMVATKQMSEQERKDRGLATVFRRDDAVLRRKTTDKREMDPSFVSENYTECYPGAYESAFAAAVVEEGDSDEDDLSKMDMGDRARKRIKPWHFESDEAYSKFTETMEATPKAAYQFGVKMSDGRKKDLKKNAKKSKEAKLNQELQKINSLLSKRKPSGGGGGD